MGKRKRGSPNLKSFIHVKWTWKIRVCSLFSNEMDGVNFATIIIGVAWDYDTTARGYAKLIIVNSLILYTWRSCPLGYSIWKV